MKKQITIASLFVLSLTGYAAEWGAEELATCGFEAVKHFGEDDKEAIANSNGLEIKKKASGMAADVLLKFVRDGQPAIKKCLCHVHGDSIDCH